MTEVTSVRLSDELTERLDRLAASLNRPRAWLIEQAILRYVEDEAAQLAAIEQALADYRAGTAKLVPHEEVMKRLDEKIRARQGDAAPLA